MCTCFAGPFAAAADRWMLAAVWAVAVAQVQVLGSPGASASLSSVP